ncbi:uncharacterized protein LOC121988531 [Zingiber officinale]|uniref:uncharacterized protein LOC121988531 n=1 Tax=Zingiber officinale TaxID=94328 RepID=UPI001C4D1FE5|nr:uncharacterized protein LOC121988531 [Zingiber officinale]
MAAAKVAEVLPFMESDLRKISLNVVDKADETCNSHSVGAFCHAQFSSKNVNDRMKNPPNCSCRRDQCCSSRLRCHLCRTGRGTRWPLSPPPTLAGGPQPCGAILCRWLAYPHTH